MQITPEQENQTCKRWAFPVRKFSHGDRDADDADEAEPTQPQSHTPALRAEALHQIVGQGSKEISSEKTLLR